MKKALLFLCLAAGLMSCAKEVLNPEKETPQNEGVPMTFNVTVLETRAAKTDWADGDKHRLVRCLGRGRLAGYRFQQPGHEDTDRGPFPRYG